MNLSIKELNELIYSLGITAPKGIFVNKELNASLIDKLYSELNSKIADEEVNEGIEFSSHFVSNDEADEDYRSTLIQDSNRYESSVEKDYDNHLNKLKQRGYITQTILDFVQLQGDATHTEIHNFYKKFTGSNSFSHVLRSLIIPYKNRPTRRYLVKNRSGNYEVKLAGVNNWVVIDDNC